MTRVAEPVGDKATLLLEAWEADTVGAGFRQEWLEAEMLAADGDPEDAHMVLAVGAGTGTPWGTFRYRRTSDGATIRLAFDGRDLVLALAALARERLDAR